MTNNQRNTTPEEQMAAVTAQFFSAALELHHTTDGHVILEGLLSAYLAAAGKFGLVEQAPSILREAASEMENIAPHMLAIKDLFDAQHATKQ